MREPRQLERALDVVLAELAAPPAPQGLRQRVLARLAVQTRRRRPRLSLGGWRVALPVAAGLAVLVWAVASVTPYRQQRVAARVPASAAPPPAEAPGATPATAPATARPRAAAPARSRTDRAPLLARGAGPKRAADGVDAAAGASADDVPRLPPLAPPPPVASAALSIVEADEPAPIEVQGLVIEPLPGQNPSGLP